MSRVPRNPRAASLLFAVAAIAAAALVVPLLLPAEANGRTAGPQEAEDSSQEPQLGIPDAPRNLQVLPAEMGTRAVVGVMRGITGALGTRCSHCHVNRGDGGLSTTDFASDEKEAKRVARIMMRMVENLNDDLLQPGLAEVGRADGLQVTCQTCHRGNTRPVRLQDVLAERFESDGVDSMLALYEELYERHYGSAVYDFSEGSLIRSANRLARAGDLEAGQALIDRNLQLYPESISTYFTWGQTLAASGEAERARASFQKCLDLNPEANWCQNAIDQLDSAQEQ